MFSRQMVMSFHSSANISSADLDLEQRLVSFLKETLGDSRNLI